jgi:hypothetical protein
MASGGLRLCSAIAITMERKSLSHLAILCLIGALGCGSMVHVATDVDRSAGPQAEDPVAVDLYLRTDAKGYRSPIAPRRRLRSSGTKP